MIWHSASLLLAPRAAPELPAPSLSRSDPPFAGCRLRARAAATMVAAAAVGIRPALTGRALARARAAAFFAEGVTNHVS